MIEREALKMCLEYIETDAHERKYVRHAIKEALSQPEQEPVAWMYPDDLKRFETSEAYAEAYSIEMVSSTQGETVPLYTRPLQRTWVGLTDEEIQYCVELKNPEAIAEEVEAKLKGKNT